MAILAPAGSIPQIGGANIPDDIRYSGQYSPIRSVATVRNGEGVKIAQGLPRVEWTWRIMSKADYQWWMGRIGNAESAKVAGETILWDHTGTLYIYDPCVVDAPVANRFENGTFREVLVVISQLT